MSLDSWMNFGAAVVLATLLGVWAWRQPRRGLAIAGILAIAATAAAGALVPTDEWLVEHLTILHEGNSERTLQALFGRGHIRDGLFNLWSDLATGRGLPVVAGLRLNLAATVLFLGGLLLAVTEFLRPTWWAALLLLSFGIATSFVVVPALSELPSALLNLYFVAALLPVALIGRGDAHTAIRFGAAALLVVLAVLMVRARAEMVILVVPAGLLLLVPLLGQASAVARLEARFMAFCAWLVGHPARLVAAVGLCLAAEFVVRSAASGETIWAATALNPLDLTVFRLPAVIAEATSLGFAALCCLGWFYALKRWKAYAGLSIAILVLGRLYLTSSHSVDAETFRYLTYISAALLWLAVLGVAQLRLIIASRPGGPLAPPAAIAVLALLCLPLGGRVVDEMRLLSPTEASSEQREARFVARQLLARPECAFIAPVAHVTGPMLLVLRAGEEPRMTLRLDEASELASASPCTLLYEGLDCHLVEGLDCSAESGEVIASEHFVAQRYSDNHEYGFMASDITLRVRRMRRVR